MQIIYTSPVLKKAHLKTDYTVAILGAGPAGAAAALSLPDGLSVVHLDKAGPAREKLCSGLLTIEAQNSLIKLLGTSKLPANVSAPPDIDVLRYMDLDNGSTMTIPLPRRYTSVLAVPRSIPISLEKYPKNLSII